MKTKLLLVLGAGLVSLAAHAQTRPDLETLGHNLAWMQADISLNKQTFLLGEEIQVTIQVSNPTNRPLAVFRPFIPGSGTIRIVELDADGNMIPGRSTVSEVPLSDRDYDDIPVDTFAAGEVRTFTFNSSDALARSPSEVEWNRMKAPSRPGRYGVYYSYKSSLARFRCVRPVLEKISEARFPVDEFDPGDDLGSPATTEPVYRYVFSLRQDGVSYLCAHRRKSGSFQRPGEPDYAGPVDPNLALSLAPYKIVGTSAAVVTSLQASMDNAENLTILYSTAAGGQPIRIDVDTNLNPR